MTIQWLTQLALIAATTEDPLATEVKNLAGVFNTTTGQPHRVGNLKTTVPAMLERVNTKYDKAARNKALGAMLGPIIAETVALPYAEWTFEDMEKVKSADIRMVDNTAKWGLKKGEWGPHSSLLLCAAASLLVKGRVNQLDLGLLGLLWWKKRYMTPFEGERTPATAYTNLRLESNLTYLEKFWLGSATSYRDENGQPLNLGAKPFDNDDLVFLSREGYAGLHKHLERVFAGPDRNWWTPHVLLDFVVPGVLFSSTMDEAVKNAVAMTKTYFIGDYVVDLCSLYAAMLWRALHGATKDELIDQEYYTDQDVIDSQGLLLMKYKTEGDPPKKIIGFEKKETLWLCTHIVLVGAIWTLINDNGNIDEGIKIAVRLGGRNSEIAMVYGALAGALYGYEKIPAEYKRDLFQREFIEDVTLLLLERKSVNNPGDTELIVEEPIDPPSQPAKLKWEGAVVLLVVSLAVAYFIWRVRKAKMPK